MSRTIIALAIFFAAGAASAQTPPRSAQQVTVAPQDPHRQIVVLDESSQNHVTKYFVLSKSNAQTDAANAALVCKDALGDRFGRLISFRKTTSEAEMFYFNRVVCEAN